jgi:hypothetical protein
MDLCKVGSSVMDFCKVGSSPRDTRQKPLFEAGTHDAELTCLRSW